MTLREILEDGYGIDFSTLKFDFHKGMDHCTRDEVMQSLSEDELIIDGQLINYFDIYADKPNGFVELYHS